MCLCVPRLNSEWVCVCGVGWGFSTSIILLGVCAGLVCECTLEGAGPYSPSPGWQSGAQGRGDTPSDLLILLGTSLGE